MDFLQQYTISMEHGCTSQNSKITPSSPACLHCSRLFVPLLPAHSRAQSLARCIKSGLYPCHREDCFVFITSFQRLRARVAHAFSSICCSTIHLSLLNSVDGSLRALYSRIISTTLKPSARTYFFRSVSDRRAIHQRTPTHVILKAQQVTDSRFKHGV